MANETDAQEQWRKILIEGHRPLRILHLGAIRGVPFIENLARLDQSMIFVIDITKCRDLPVALCNALM
jgi:hypothetical protein